MNENQGTEKPTSEIFRDGARYMSFVRSVEGYKSLVESSRARKHGLGLTSDEKRQLSRLFDCLDQSAQEDIAAAKELERQYGITLGFAPNIEYDFNQTLNKCRRDAGLS